MKQENQRTSCDSINLSYPEFTSINHFIDSEQSSVTYYTLDDLAATIAKLRQGAYL